MRCSKWLVTAVVYGLVLVLSGNGSIAVADEVPPGLVEFIGELVQKHSYMFQPEEIGVLDRLNRELREGDHQKRNGKDDAERKAGAARMTAAAEEFFVHAEYSSVVQRISLEDGKVTPAIRGPFELPGDRGAVIFRIASGEGPVRCVTQDVSLSEKPWGIEIDCEPGGTTWALIGLNHMPARSTVITVEFRRKDMAPVKDLMEITTPDKGRLNVTVLSDDTGKPTPAMMRITSKTDKRDRRPDNAIDFSPQFDNQGRASGHRKTNLPGSLGGEWWIVPEPFDMAVPPGEYEIAIRRGAEHVPLTDTISVESGKQIELTYRPRRWVDMRQAGWYSGDDHVHCQILSDDDARRLMAWVQAEDIHVANVVKMGDIFRTWFEQRGFGPDYRVIDRDYVLSPGQECPRTHEQIGHTISMNITSMVRDADRYYLYDWVADAVHNQGGLFGFAHVNRGIFHVHRGMSLFVPRMKCDFVELLQFNNMEPDLYYEFLNLGFKVTASAGSDVPWGGSVGEVRLYAFVGDEPFTVDRWFDAVRKGHTFVTNGPMVELRVDDGIPGDEIIVREGQKLHVKARVWGHPERSRPDRIELVRCGEVIQEAKADGEGADEIKIDMKLDAGDGFWLAVRAFGVNGTKAHTTPVYVQREGLRFWKFDAVDELIAKRMESLKQVENIVAEARTRLGSGETAADQTLKELAEQGDDLLKRVEGARSIYEKLRQTAEKEREIRQASN